MAFLNGQATTAQLAKADNGHTFAKGIAEAFDRVAAAFEKVNGQALECTQGYRSLAIQKKIFLERYKVQAFGSGPFGDVRWYGGRRYVRVTGAAAAIPGTSNHGLGVAVDLSTKIGFGTWNSAQYEWMAKNGPKYGWTNTEGRAVNEPWHWVYNANLDRMKPSSLLADGVIGAKTYAEWQRQLGGLTADGIFGEKSVKRLRVRINAKNGKGGFKLVAGPLKGGKTLTSRDIKAVQKLLNVWVARGVIDQKKLKIDGTLGKLTVTALQKSLNANLWEKK